MIKRFLLAALLIIGIASPAFAVVPTCTGNITSVYWVVGDTNPTTSVYDPARGYVTNSDATFLTWLASAGACPVTGGAISAAVTNGGLVKLTVASTANLQTSQEWRVYGTDSAVYDGNWVITVNDATHVTLQGSTFSVNVTGGAIYGPQVIATNAALMTNVNSYNALVARTGYNSITSAVNVVLTNPMAQFQLVSISTTGKNVKLPVANVVGAPPIGAVTRFFNNGSISFQINLSDATLLYNPINTNDFTDLILVDNTTAVGTWRALPVPNIPPAGQGTSNLLIDSGSSGGFAFYASHPLSGDCTNAAGGVITCTKLNSVSPGTIWAQNANAVAITGGTLTGLTGLAIRDTSAAFDVTLAAVSSSTLTAGRTLTLDMGNVAHTLAFGTTANTITFPSVASDTVALIAASQELTNKTLNASVGKGTWTASGTWTLPAITLGGTVSGGGNQINNVIIGTTSPLAGTFTAITTTTGLADFQSGVIVSDGGAVGTYPAGMLTQVTGSLLQFGINDSQIGSTPAYTQAKQGGFFRFDARDGNNVFQMYLRPAAAATPGTLQFYATSAGDFHFQAAIDATSTSTGTIVNTGGMAVNKRVWMNGLTSSGSTQTDYLCLSSAGEVIADTIACLASSERFKEKIETLPVNLSIRLVEGFRAKSWRYKHEDGSVFPGRYYRERIGLTAEDVARIDPRLVEYDADGQPRAIDYNAVVALIAASVGQIKADNDNLRAELIQLKKAANQ